MNKCYRCAELEGCWAGLHGEGKEGCKCFCPCYFSKDEKHLILVHESEWEQLVDANKGEVLCENHKLEAVDILNALKINFKKKALGLVFQLFSDIFFLIFCHVFCLY